MNNNYYVFQDSNHYFIIKNWFHLVLPTTREISSLELDTSYTESEIDRVMSHTMNIIFKPGDLVENQSGVCIKNISNKLQKFSDALDIHRYRYIKLTDLDDTGLQLWKELNLN